jgi:hypothetical protein
MIAIHHLLTVVHFYIIGLNLEVHQLLRHDAVDLTLHSFAFQNDNKAVQLFEK